jgi:hypothetical protein
MSTKLNEEIYGCLNRLSNSVGMVINEYHWREFCDLMKMMCYEDMIVLNKPLIHNEKEIQHKSSYDELLKIITSGCKFKYYSYDHKKAMLEYNSLDEYKEKRKWFKNLNSWDMPIELKEKYRVERIGKLRMIQFAPDGEAFKFKIGAKRAKTFKLDDFGVNVFPII